VNTARTKCRGCGGWMKNGPLTEKTPLQRSPAPHAGHCVDCAAGLLRVTGVVCPACDAFIFSRARHDFHGCPCGACHVNGGFDYLRVGWQSDRVSPPRQEVRKIEATKKQLYDDWNRNKDKWGVIPGKTPTERLAASRDEEK
jgi:hypothetical protein